MGTNQHSAQSRRSVGKRNASDCRRLHQQGSTLSDACICCSTGELVASGTHVKFLSAVDAYVGKKPPPGPHSKL